MSALHSKVDIAKRCWDIRFVANKRHRVEQIEQAMRSHVLAIRPSRSEQIYAYREYGPVGAG
jgi:hypothetical protein